MHVSWTVVAEANANARDDASLGKFHATEHNSIRQHHHEIGTEGTSSSRWPSVLMRHEQAYLITQTHTKLAVCVHVRQ